MSLLPSVSKVKAFVLNHSNFASPQPHPGGYLAMSEDIFFVLATGREGYWHLINRDQGCCKHPTTHRADPTAKNYLAPMSIMLKLRNLELEVRECRENK